MSERKAQVQKIRVKDINDIRMNGDLLLCEVHRSDMTPGGLVLPEGSSENTLEVVRAGPGFYNELHNIVKQNMAKVGDFITPLPDTIDGVIIINDKEHVFVRDRNVGFLRKAVDMIAPTSPIVAPE